MTTCVLVRHAKFDFGRTHLAGRSDDALSACGYAQAEALASRLPEAPDVLQASPRRRCLETIAPYSAACSVPIKVCAALDEVDFGSWAGRSFAELSADPLWLSWNVDRERARPPFGETMGEAQTRILRHLDQAAQRYPGATVVMVTHAELMRAAILACRGLPLDAWPEIDVPHASVAVIVLGRSERRLIDTKVPA